MDKCSNNKKNLYIHSYLLELIRNNEQVSIMNDEIKKKIINILLKNSRVSARMIAKELNISVATVTKKMRELEKERIIRKYSVVLNYDKLDYDIPVIIDIRVSKGKLLQVEKKIATNPNVFAVYDNTGNFDATIIARFKNRKSMDNFLKKIQTFDFVERTETKLILNTMKEEGIRIR